MNGMESIDGWVLPKVTPKNLPAFAETAARLPHLLVMPTIETEVAFDRRHLCRLRNSLERLLNPVLCLRVGGNDLLSRLGLKRPKHMTLYDTPLRNVINDIILTFRPAGYEIASPVFEHMDSPVTLKREVEMDVVHGLLAKTAIHPTQIAVIEETYRVSRQEREMAERILAPNARAVFQYAGQMCEPATHRPWAERLLLRAELFGML
jgi:citrate lyase beta subunit